MGRAPVDVQLVSMGYLPGPDGQVRHIPGLDVIARDTLAAGIAVSWGDTMWGRWAMALLWRRRIILAPALFDAPGWVVKEAWTHELAHVLMETRSERRARWLQDRLYGDLITPPIWAA